MDSLDYQSTHSIVLLTIQLTSDIMTSYTVLNISAKCRQKSDSISRIHVSLQKLSVNKSVNVGTELYSEKTSKL